MPDGKGMPCGACREVMMQLDKSGAGEIEVLRDYETKQVAKLKP